MPADAPKCKGPLRKARLPADVRMGKVRPSNVLPDVLLIHCKADESPPVVRRADRKRGAAGRSGRGRGPSCSYGMRDTSTATKAASGAAVRNREIQRETYTVRIAIAGGGIGGLTLALALHRSARIAACVGRTACRSRPMRASRSACGAPHRHPHRGSSARDLHGSGCQGLWPPGATDRMTIRRANSKGTRNFDEQSRKRPM